MEFFINKLQKSIITICEYQQVPEKDDRTEPRSKESGVGPVGQEAFRRLSAGPTKVCRHAFVTFPLPQHMVDLPWQMVMLMMESFFFLSFFLSLYCPKLGEAKKLGAGRTVMRVHLQSYWGLSIWGLADSNKQ
jgi:hypothetical protein